MTDFIFSADSPTTRLRRNRRTDFVRRLPREPPLTTSDAIYPVFVKAGEGVREAVPSMPGVVRYSRDTVLEAAQQCMELGIPVLALFPVIESSLKPIDGREAANPQGLIPEVVRTLKQNFPDLGILTDEALEIGRAHV